MMTIEEFERELSQVELIDDFVDVIAGFINSIEDPALRALAVLEVMKLRLDDGKTKTQP
jgi:hypothetical protein